MHTVIYKNIIDYVHVAKYSRKIILHNIILSMEIN